MKTPSLILLLQLCAFICCSQEWTGDLKKMNDRYSSAGSFIMDLSVKVFEKSNPAGPAMTYQGKVAKQGDKSYSEMIGKITIINEEGSLFVDEQQKIIIFKKHHKAGKNKNKAEILPFTLDSTTIANTKASYLENSAKGKKIRLINKKYLYETIDFVLDPLYHLRQITFYTKQNSKEELYSKVVVDYSNVEVSKGVPDNIFSLRKYVNLNGGKATLTSAYKGYELINN